ncbi:DUF1493 family protein [Flavobacterium azooxidireducens]|uniref:DUF1493 family protein n=1 Tax=Flavobacterium azooxidireducens TaxID=1871076 RepID=A0ABY4KI14_9FLAO|nr:DUF1493 family protein [Flavobacterium azooxidireducens]UPQ80465.1 DUF1493 family protein [Flavobacterium azooxidireducens]
MSEVEKEVITFFKEKRIISESDNINTIINKPDYLADEAYFLMESFFEKFKVEKGYLDIDKYFNPLPKLDLKYFINLLRFKRIVNNQKPVITLYHLIKVAEKREWFDPV